MGRGNRARGAWIRRGGGADGDDEVGSIREIPKRPQAVGGRADLRMGDFPGAYRGWRGDLDLGGHGTA